MRTISAAQQAVISSGSQAEHLRLSVKDTTAVWRDLTSYPGFNALKEVMWGEKVDDPHMTLGATLHREAFKLSLSPFMTGSAINRRFDASASSDPLLALTREVKLEVAIVAMDRQPSSGDWFEVFRGRIDKLNAARGRDVTFECRGLSGRLAQQFIKKELVYSYAADGGRSVPLRIWEPQIPVTVSPLVYLLPASRGDDDPGLNKFLKCSQAGTTGTTEPTWTTGAGQVDGTAKWDYVGAPSTGGNPVEQVMQNLLDDHKSSADPTVTLFTPTSPGWAIRQYIQQREFVLDAVRRLAGQIGWDLRFKWRDGTSQFELTFYEPPRSAPTVAFTFAPSDYCEPTSMEVDIEQIRTSWTVRYADRTDLWPDGTPKRKEVNVSDPAAVAKYGELWAEIVEDENGNIDSPTEANKLANNALSDCKDPTVEMAVPLTRGFPWVELNDYYTFTADGVRFDTNQSLAVTQVTQHGKVSDDGKAVIRTELGVRGLPTAGALVHLQKTVRPMETVRKPPHQSVQFQGTKTPKPNFLDVVGGVRVQLDLTTDKHQLLEEYEIHVSSTPGFTPDDTTLVALTKGRSAELGDLNPGHDYHARVVPRYYNGSRLIRGQPSAETSFTAGQGNAAHLIQGVRWGRQPLNGGFETWLDDTIAPDHFELDTPNVTGASFEPVDGATGDNWFSGDKHAMHRIGTSAQTLSTDPFTVRRGASYDVEWSVYIVPAAGLSGKSSLNVKWLDADLVDLGVDVEVDNVGLDGAGGVAGGLSAATWYTRSGSVTAPSTARFARLYVKTKTLGDVGNAVQVHFDELEIERT